MYEALHGDGTTAPSPVLKLFANLKNNRVSRYYNILYLSHMSISVIWKSTEKIKWRQGY